MRIYVHLLLLFVVISTILLLGSCQTTPSSNNEDREALLDLKSFITSDPSGALSSWGNGSSECTWTGVMCKSKQGGRVTELDLRDHNLVGTISPHISNLIALSSLYLQENHYVVNIPNHLGRLRQLQMLNLNSNLLTRTIPLAFTNYTGLMTINLSGNVIFWWNPYIHPSSSEASDPKHGEEPARRQYSLINW